MWLIVLAVVLVLAFLFQEIYKMEDEEKREREQSDRSKEAGEGPKDA